MVCFQENTLIHSQSPTLWSSPLSGTLNQTTSITYYMEPLTNPTTCFQLSSPSQDTCDSQRCSTQISGEGAEDLTAHSPVRLYHEAMHLQQGRRTTWQVYCQHYLTLARYTPIFRPPLSSTNHRHKYPSQNPPHLRKWDSPHQPAPPTWHHQGCFLHQKPKASSYIMLNQGTHWSSCSEKCVLIYIFKYKL